MSNATQTPSLPLVAKLLRSYLKSGLRGQTRLTFLLAQHLKTLQAVPITINGLAPVYVDLRHGIAHDLLKASPLLSPPWEIDEQTIMRRFVKEGDVVFDIGANIGMHTVLLSQLVGASGKVYAFEPNNEILTVLNHTIEMLDNTTLFPYALSDEVSDSVLFVPEDSMKASLADWTRASDTRRVKCQQRRLDDLIDQHSIRQPDFIKCDVEGAETKVFEGGRRTLDREDAPIILFEYSVHTAEGFGSDASSAKNFLASLPHPYYQFFISKKGTGMEPLQALKFDGANILALPRAKRGCLIDSQSPV